MCWPHVDRCTCFNRGMPVICPVHPQGYYMPQAQSMTIDNILTLARTQAELMSKFSPKLDLMEVYKMKPEDIIKQYMEKR